MRPPLHDCKKSRILTRGRPRFLIKYDWRLAPERERERYSKNIGMAKRIGHFLLSLNNIYYVLSS